MNISKIRSEKMIREVRDTVSNWKEYAWEAKLNEAVFDEISKQHLKFDNS